MTPFFHAAHIIVRKLCSGPRHGSARLLQRHVTTDIRILTQGSVRQLPHHPVSSGACSLHRIITAVSGHQFPSPAATDITKSP
jgi:hypothetical protein